MNEDQYMKAIKAVFPTATKDEVMRIMLLIEESYKDGWKDGYNETDGVS